MRLIVFLIGFLPLVSPAQEKAVRTCRLLMLGDRGSVPAPLFLHDGTTAREVEVPRMNLSVPYEMPPGALTLRLLTSMPAEGQPVAAAAPSGAVGESIGSFYLLVTADPSNKTVPVRMQVIDASADRFKNGQMLWYNLTANEVYGQVGKQQVAIKGRSRAITDPPATAAEDYNVNLSYRIAGNPAVYPVCETRWLHNPQARTILFIVTDGSSPIPRVLAFPDNPEDGNQPGGKNP
jgi:hypothetical protein